MCTSDDISSMPMFPLIPVIRPCYRNPAVLYLQASQRPHSDHPRDRRIITMPGIAFDQGRHSRSKASPKASASVPRLLNPPPTVPPISIFD
ncbi:hypothetical protein BMW22_19475 [Rhizobium leguminosarum]|uniref:Uncharacterized protein n=1 Tax=Rhizobium leguminosarum TaxID=384 RepID=A0A1L3ZCZ9_RHILE|nr:hypothetical protein BMW22_19475 [Rhizobium leguminosarum]